MSRFANSAASANGSVEAAHQGAAGTTAKWRQSRWLILVELLVVILVFVADAKHYIPLSKTPFQIRSTSC
jgi:hypothetical protein